METSQYQLTSFAATFLLLQLKTLTSITSLMFTKLVGMMGYHYMFLILQYFKVYPNLNEVVSINANLIWAVAIYPNVYNICKSV